MDEHVDYPYEIGIAWIDGIEQYPYARESVGQWMYRRKPPRLGKRGTTILLGYAELAPDCPNDPLERRIWQFHTDKDPYPPRRYPSEAVDPRQVRFGYRTPTINNERSRAGKSGPIPLEALLEEQGPQNFGLVSAGKSSLLPSRRFGTGEGMPPPVPVRLVPLENSRANRYARKPGKLNVAERAEGALVTRYAAFLAESGQQVARNEITPPGEPRQYTDLYSITTRELVEAKSDISRESVRMAVGQLLDYRRWVKPETVAVLLPSRPSIDLLDYLSACHVAVIVEVSPGEFIRL